VVTLLLLEGALRIARPLHGGLDTLRHVRRDIYWNLAGNQLAAPMLVGYLVRWGWSSRCRNAWCSLDRIVPVAALAHRDIYV
jgi:hypothetical protein